jgi:NADPH:quinone reductase-like Zn-dependent oxidoreductase
MLAYEIHGGFGLDRLRRVERPDPRPGPGEVLLRMSAASLNYRDLLMVKGRYNPRQPLPLVPLSDGVGEVIEVGAGVSRVQVGDRVATMFAQHWLSGPPTRDKLKLTLGGPLDGVLAEQVVVHADGVSLVPHHLSDVEASTLPCAALTAWTALMDHGKVRPGETVLVQGTGGVSMFALQIASMAGARVIVTSSSHDKLEKARALGAWQTIHYPSTPEWGKTAVELSGGAGVDHVIEVGGAGTLQQSLRAVRPGGHVAIIGILAGSAGEVNLLPVLMQNLRMEGVMVGHREAFEGMCRAIQGHELQPVIDSVFAWTEVRDALEHLGSGQHFGKICLAF